MIDVNTEESRNAELQSEETARIGESGSGEQTSTQSNFQQVSIAGVPHIAIFTNNPGRTGPAIYAKQIRTAEGRPTYALNGLIDPQPDTPEPSSEDENPQVTRMERRARDRAAIPSKKVAVNQSAAKTRKRRRGGDVAVFTANPEVEKEVKATKAKIAVTNRAGRTTKGRSTTSEVLVTSGSLNPRKATISTDSKASRGASNTGNASSESNETTGVNKRGRASASEGKGKATMQDDDSDGIDDEEDYEDL